MEKVSFYVPCFNAEKYLDMCLESILKQTCPIQEILVIDDGSTDNSFNIASRYNVKIIKKEKNEGLASARNTALNIASGDFIASCDSDVSLNEKWLEQSMRNFTGPDIAGVGGRLLERNKEKLPDRWRAAHLVQHWGDEKLINPRSLYGANTVFRRKILIDTGKYNELYRTNKEDSDMCERIKKSGKKIIYDPEAIAEHIRTDSIQSVLNTYYGWKKHYYMQNNTFYENFNTLWGKVNFSINTCYDIIIHDINKKLFDVLYPTVLIMFRFVLRDIKECKANKDELVIASLIIKNILLGNDKIPVKIKEKIMEDIMDFIPVSQREYISKLNRPDKDFLSTMDKDFKEFDKIFISRLYNLMEDRLKKIPVLLNFNKTILNKKESIKNLIQHKSSNSTSFALWEKLRFAGEKGYIKMKHLSYFLIGNPTSDKAEEFWNLIETSCEL